MTRRVVAALAIAALAALAALAAGCSAPGYPGVLDPVTPRADDPMTPAQVKQATDDLISDRNQLNAQAPADGSANVTGSTAPATGAAAKP